MPELFVGLMSGTSLDGVDAVLVDFSSGVNVLHATTLPFDEPLRESLRKLIDQPQSANLDEIGHADAALGIAYSAAVLEVLKKSGTAANEIRAIGCHGQTIRHSPDAKLPFTWQIGDPNRIAAVTGVPVVADFRRMDVALGGQGAPLVPAFHAAMFGSTTELRVVVNIGGIANLTRLGPTITGYDTGPGNGLMDAWIHRNRGEAFDKDGEWAASGKVEEELLARFSADSYFQKTPPRSTGREYFNLGWLHRHLSGREYIPENVQATLLAFTVESIAHEVHRAKAERVLLCGGGTRNKMLYEGLVLALRGIPVQRTNDYGLDADFVEAAAFAWLARQRLLESAGNIPSVTGAGEATILGGIYRR